MIRNITIQILLISFCYGTGKYGDSFMNIGISARNSSLGGAVVADIGNSSSFNLSPATISGIINKKIYGLFVNQFGLAEFCGLGVFIPFKENYTIGLSFRGLLVDDIPERPDLRLLTDLEARRDSIRALTLQGFDTFQDLETAYTISMAKMNQPIINPGWQFSKFPIKIPIGINIHLLQKKIHDIQAFGTGLDLGTALTFELSNILPYKWLGEVSLGSSFNHLFGTRLFWNSEKKEMIPMQWINGIAIKQPIPILKSSINSYIQSNNQYPNEIQYGLEWISSHYFAIRLGYKNKVIQGGLGINLDLKNIPLRMDYSFSDHFLGNAHRIGIVFSF